MGMTWAWALVMSLLQDHGMGELLTQLESEEPKKRQEAMEAIVGGWAKWKEEDLKKLAQAQEGSDVEVKTRVREAVKRVDICRKVGAKVVEKMPGIDRMLCEIDAKECVKVLEKVWEACPREDLGGVVELAKGMPWSVEEKMELLNAIEVKKMRSYAGLAAAWLKDSDAEVRGSSVSTLGTLGAKEQAGAIATLLKDSEEGVRWSAARALANLDAKEHLQAIGELLKDSESFVQAAAIGAIGRLGPPAQEAQADELGRKLDALQKDQSEDVRFAAAVARIGWERATVQEESNPLQECKEGWQAVELIDALTRRYEKEGYKAMTAQREVKEDLKSWEDVKGWAKEGGLELEGSGTLERTIWKGAERSMLQVIAQELNGKLWQIEGKKVRVVGWEEALKYWQQRLKR